MKEQWQERLERMRLEALPSGDTPERMYLDFFRFYEKDDAAKDDQLRYADAFAYALSRTEPHIGGDDRIVGRFSAPMNAEERAEWNALNERFASKVILWLGQDSHMAVDYGLLLSEGISGIKARIAALDTDADSEKHVFYTAAVTCLDAVVAHAHAYADEAERLRALCAENDAERRGELALIASACRRVPEYPAESFFEAVQSAQMLTYCLSYSPLRYFSTQQMQLGHPDRYLYPYYQKDTASGILTREDAQEYIDCLAVLINHRVCRGLSSGWMVGGRDSDGNVVANDLTELCMRVIDRVRLVYPSVGLCYTREQPAWCLSTACEILSHGRSHPAIFNDDVITRGLVSYGVPETEAHSYIHSTCVEITPVGSSNVWVASPYTNLPGILLEVLRKGEYHDIEAVFSACFARLDTLIREHFEEQNRFRARRMEGTCNPLLSCFVNDCIASGTDIERGGARYNWIMPSFVGMANLVDSLYAVKTAVFEEHRFTMEQLLTMLDADFKGYETERLYLQDGIIKYGNDADEIDCWFTRIVTHIIDECAKYTPMHRNAHLIPSVFCWVMHERFGSETGATPDGRVAGFPLGDGSGPCQGREHKGPTASILSSTKWPHEKLIGGVAVNLKFSTGKASPQFRENLQSLVRAYLSRGGFEVQINVLDREKLLKAQENPEEYRDLVVRIGGYSDYFVRLSPAMQAEVLARTEHTL